MKKMVSAAVALAAAALTAAPMEVFVSVDGDDANPGTRAKPLATPKGARDALRRARSANGGRIPDGGATVEFADGVYLVEAPLVLERQDSGADGAPVVWRAAHRGKAVFSGALRLAEWKRVEDPAMVGLLQGVARGKVVTAGFPEGSELPGFCGSGCGAPPNLLETPLSLFQGTRRLMHARWPNEGFALTGENIGEIERRHDVEYCRSGVFKFSSPRLSAWAGEPELWAYGLWCYEWADAKTRVLSVDPATGTMSVDPAPVGFGIREKAKFHVLNAVSEIDRPGEWAIDRARRRVYLWPVGSEPAVFAYASGLVSAQGVSDVAFDGFVFEHSRTTAVVFKDALRVKVLSSVFRHTSSGGIAIWRGRDCRVQGCDMYDLGEGGIILDGGDFKELVPGNNVADNNHIHHFGQVLPIARPGVRLFGVGNRSTHNLIHHAVHQAIIFGGNDHYVGFNVCHDCCMYNDDAGVIYCVQRDWSKRGTIVERNIIHMTGKRPKPTHTHAIYLDDDSSGVAVRGNVINRASIGVNVNGGQDCDVSGNVMMNCEVPVCINSRGIDTYVRNVAIKGRESGMFRKLEANRALFEGPLWKSRYPNMLRVFDLPDAQRAHEPHFNSVTNNLFVSCKSRTVKVRCWKHVSGTCVVTNNLDVASDPGFEDYAHFGWELAPCQARDLVGSLHIKEIGLYESPLRASPAIQFAPGVTPPPPLGLLEK